MKLEKAKAILQLNIKEAGKQMPLDVKTALELGSYSIQLVIDVRQGRPLSLFLRLPGETDDNGDP